jgi:peptidoglycan/LPS O-acetylase OafA/YrhL
MTQINMQTQTLSTKPHFEILDGLRGIAAIMVLIYHIFEAYSVNRFELIIGHGYMAVDFFFVLSGFIVGYAYDSRWQKMSFGAFLKRRIIRLHPMVVFGMILGAILFYFGESSIFPLIKDTAIWKMLLYLLLGILLIPTPPSADIRGWQEMHTLDAPAWSLFFEYIANILYGLFIRKFSKAALAVLVGIAACAVIYLTIFVQGDVFGGWTFDGQHLYVGFTRLMYPFFAGLLLFRLKKLASIKNALLWCTLLLLAALVIPRIGGETRLWMNGIYEAAVILIIFPLIVFMGASGNVQRPFIKRLCKLLGDMSYPMYLINYPVLYLYTAWIADTHYTLAESYGYALLLFALVVVLSYAVMRWYDKPLRKWLMRTKTTTKCGG